MITINLLRNQRVNERRRQRGLRTQALTSVAVVACALGACAYMWVSLDRDLDHWKVEKRAHQSRLETLTKRVLQAEALEKEIRVLIEKNRKIRKLLAQQKNPIRLLDHVSRSLDPLNLWLVDLQAEGSRVALNGVAATRQDILEFTKNLGGTDFFHAIKIVETREEANRPGLYRFTVTMVMEEPTYAGTHS